MSTHTPSHPPWRLPGPPSRAGRGVLVALLGMLLVLVLPGVAAAGPYLDQTVSGLRQQNVYVADGAEDVLKTATVDQLKADAGTTMYFAVVPEAALQETGGNPDEFLTQIAKQVRKQGVYALVAPTHFRAGATDRSGFQQGAVPSMADQAVKDHPDNLDAAVLDFANRVQAAAVQGGGQGQGTDGQGDAPAPQQDSGGVGAGTILLALLGIGAVGGGFVLFRSRQRRKEQERRELEDVKRTAQEDLIALADDIRNLDIDVQLRDEADEARKHHAAAVAAYERAAAALDRATRPADIAGVSAALEEGRFEIATAKALLNGEEPPKRRPPCFFDTRHGPSVRDVTWAPPGGVPRQVPACAADALRVEQGMEPETRQVMVGDRSEPFYNAPGYYAPWYGGYFGGFGGGGLLTGLLIGSALGGGFGGWGGGFGAYGAGYDAGYDAGGEQGGDGGDGGDFGGGDFGGGDFGGGDFGGGDFGGGDFGGGDF
jgi:hypothetical protein